MAQAAHADPGGQRAPGIYVHVPFCTRVCPYCDFAVRTGGAELRRAFVDTLLQEIDGWSVGGGSAADGRPDRPDADRQSLAAEGADDAPVAARRFGPTTWRRDASTVYFGGGTPSALAPQQLEEVLARLRLRLPVADDAEWTLEANPEDVSPAALGDWRRLGFTRLSLGVQSFDDAALALLGRAHRAEQAVAAVEAALAAGFDAVSVDLIFAVPGQSSAAWETTVRRAAALQPHHVSCYELTVHPETGFFRARQQGRLAEVADDRKADLFFATHRLLADAGFAAYEVSNFAREPGYRSRHNTKYWSHAPYLGLGPSAHSFDGATRRWWNVRDLAGWSAAVGAGGAIAGDERLRGPDLALEALALGLRTVDGADLRAIEARYGVVLADNNAARIDGLVAEGLVREERDACLRPTLEGMALADTLATTFDIVEVSAVAATDDDRGPR